MKTDFTDSSSTCSIGHPIKQVLRAVFGGEHYWEWVKGTVLFRNKNGNGAEAARVDDERLSDFLNSVDLTTATGSRAHDSAKQLFYFFDAASR